MLNANKKNLIQILNFVFNGCKRPTKSITFDTTTKLIVIINNNNSTSLEEIVAQSKTFYELMGLKYLTLTLRKFMTKLLTLT